jgi:hypothetical protein
MKIKRVYHSYEKWEEYKNGMWKSVKGDERESYLQKVIKFISNSEVYGRFMMKAINDWPISCEHNLTCKIMNRQAWIGHAACCIALGCPEDITREAWGYLTDDQQMLANERADMAIAIWEEQYIESLSCQK